MELPTENPEKIAYALDVAGQLIGCGPRRVRELVDSGQLPARRDGNRVVILRDDLEAYAAKLPPYEPKKTT